MFHDVSGSPKNPKIKGRDPWNSNHGTSGGCGKLLGIVPNMDLMDASAKKTLSSNQIALFPLGFGTSVKSQYIYIKPAEVDTVSMVHAIPLSPPSFHPVAKMTPWALGILENTWEHLVHSSPSAPYQKIFPLGHSMLSSFIFPYHLLSMTHPKFLPEKPPCKWWRVAANARNPAGAHGSSSSRSAAPWPGVSESRWPRWPPHRMVWGLPSGNLMVV